MLPAQIVPDVTIEDVQPLFNNETFVGVADHLGRYALDDIRAVRFALVHRYNTNQAVQSHQVDQQSTELVRNLAACLRLIRPMHQRAGLMRGDLRAGALHLEYIEHQVPMEVPELHRLFSLRDGDVDLFRAVANDFLQAMAGEFWKFRMAVEFHEAGYFLGYWKARYILWCSAIEAVYTSENSQHRGSLVAKERIKWFLGAGTSIYSPGDIPRFMQQVNISIENIVGDLYDLRNLIAHGSRIPHVYFQRKMRQGANGELSVLDAVQEAASFIARSSLLRILQNNLLNHFADSPSAEAYFGAVNLTRRELEQLHREARP